MAACKRVRKGQLLDEGRRSSGSSAAVEAAIPAGGGGRGYSSEATLVEQRSSLVPGFPAGGGGGVLDLAGATKEYYDYRRSLYGDVTHKGLLVDAVGTLLVPSQPTAQVRSSSLLRLPASCDFLIFRLSAPLLMLTAARRLLNKRGDECHKLHLSIPLGVR